ncbi:MAG: XRE family transcriptional regulator [Rodentibacter sp.]
MSKPNIYDKEFSERMMKIAKLKFNDNLSLFARAVGVVQPSLARWAKGEADPTRTNLVKIAEASGVSLDWLALGVGDMEGKALQPVKHDINLLASHDDTFVEIEDCRDVIVTAGYGGVNDNYLESKKTKIERDWLRARGLKAEDCAKYRVCGDSMDDTLKDGEDIIVHHASKTLIDGKIFVLNNKGSMLIKRVQRTFGGVELLSDNSTYRPIKLTAEEADSLLVIGQVVLGYRNF